MNLANQTSQRQRAHILKDLESKFINYLCPRIPKWITPDMLTLLGLLGSVIIASGLILGATNNNFLLFSILGFFIHWFGDSLDGRLAYYRNVPRKWYGWALDLNADWISVCIIGFGFYYYFPSYKFLAFAFVVAYGGSMILSLMKYKITNKYTIDKGNLGPTELRVILSFILLIEIFLPSTLILFSGFATILMLALNVMESVQILKSGDDRDKLEKQLKALSA